MCRGHEFYVDIYSESPIELGTKEYPYKSAKAIFIELLNYHSNQDKSVSIYLKENQNHYFEDGTNFFLNITSVRLTTYSDDDTSMHRAKVIPTRIAQSPDNYKTAFTLLKNTTLMRDEVIAAGGFTDAENFALNDGTITLLTLRSNTYIDNIDVERDSGDLGVSTIFLYVAYLQEKELQLTNVDINVTGIIANGIDPFKGLFENMTIDGYGVERGMEFYTTCNYPEASLTSEMVYNNIKLVMSSDRTIPFSPSMIEYQGPGNMTIQN